MASLLQAVQVHRTKRCWFWSWGIKQQ